jgi:hypothetical protein
MIAALRRLSLRLDRAGNRALERAYPPLRRAALMGRREGRRAWQFLGPRLRPPAALFFRALAAGERVLRRAGGAAARAATAASAVLTPARAIGLVAFAAGCLLAASQFIDYRAVEIGQPGYAALSGVARAPTVAARSAGEAHAYLLAPVGLLAAGLGLLAMVRQPGRRLGLAIAALGLVSLLVVLLIDRPAGLDAGAQTSRFAGASAVLEDGFYAELAAAGGMLLAGLLYYARPCRIRISSSGRAASARRRRPRRQASSRGRVARSA